MPGGEMPGAEVEEQLRAASLEVEGAIRLLVSPSPGSLDRCARILESAGRRIAGLQPQLREEGRTSMVHNSMVHRSNAREAALRLRSSVSRAGRLLEGAASFHLNWSRMRDTLCAGYTRQGDPAKAPQRNRISIQG